MWAASRENHCETPPEPAGNRRPAVVGRLRRVVVARRCTQDHLRRVMVETPLGPVRLPPRTGPFFVSDRAARVRPPGPGAAIRVPGMPNDYPHQAPPAASGPHGGPGQHGAPVPYIPSPYNGPGPHGANPQFAPEPSLSMPSSLRTARTTTYVMVGLALLASVAVGVTEGARGSRRRVRREHLRRRAAGPRLFLREGGAWAARRVDRHRERADPARPERHDARQHRRAHRAGGGGRHGRPAQPGEHGRVVPQAANPGA